MQVAKPENITESVNPKSTLETIVPFPNICMILLEKKSLF